MCFGVTHWPAPKKADLEADEVEVATTNNPINGLILLLFKYSSLPCLM